MNAPGLSPVGKPRELVVAAAHEWANTGRMTPAVKWVDEMADRAIAAENAAAEAILLW